MGFAARMSWFRFQLWAGGVLRFASGHGGEQMPSAWLI
jgi:hypothetical protein